MLQQLGLTRRGLLMLATGAGVQASLRLYAGSSDFWNKKEPAEWSSDEIDKLVTKSPWARQVTASSPAMSRQYGGSGGNGGGMGDPGVGGGGGGYPGGGGGYPGGGGGGYPGGGGMGGRGSGGGGRRGGGGPMPVSYTATVRWESAKPVQEALKTPLPEGLAGAYVISVSIYVTERDAEKFKPFPSPISRSCGSTPSSLICRRRWRRRSFSSCRCSPSPACWRCRSVAAEGEKSWHRRPVAVLVVSTIAVCWGVLTQLGTTTPWSPHMSAWSGDPLPVQSLHDATPLVRQGAVVFQAKQCRNCHSIGGAGGERGPALDAVATRMTIDQMRFKVVPAAATCRPMARIFLPRRSRRWSASLKRCIRPMSRLPTTPRGVQRRCAAKPAPESSAPAIRARRHDALRQSHDRLNYHRRPLHSLGHSLDRDLRARAHCAHLYARLERIRRTRTGQFRCGPSGRIPRRHRGVFVAVASPLDTFSESLLFMHMAQHYVLMLIAPPLIVLGAPVVPMLRGLPRLFIRLLRPLFVLHDSSCQAYVN